MERISEAILDKVRVDAQNIIKKAEEKAREEIEKATKQQEARLLEEKKRIIEEAKAEAARIISRASIKSRLELLVAKTRLVDDIIGRVKESLSGFSADEAANMNLIKEALGVLGGTESIIYTSPKDVSSIQKLIKADKELANRVAEFKEYNCLGGVIVEAVDGKLRIDNTYETRLEMMLPKLLPEINKELFQG